MAKLNAYKGEVTVTFIPDERRGAPEPGNTLALARDDARFAREADSELRTTLRAVTTLFGPVLGETLHRAIELVTDSQDSAIGRYDAVVVDLAEQLPDWYEMACSALQVSSSEGLS